MNKFLISIVFLSLIGGARFGHAVVAPNIYDNETLSASQQHKIQEILVAIKDAAASGDEQLVAKTLLDAVAGNPSLATQIITAYAAYQTAANQELKASGKVINVNNVVNLVIAGLQTQPGGEALLAAILSTYIPAAGGDQAPVESVNIGQTENSAQTLASSSQDIVIPRENRNQTSPK